MKPLFKFLLIFLLANSAQAQFNELWQKTHNGPGDYTDVFTCMTTDDAGNVYVAGYSMEIGENANFLVAKYNSSGALVWQKTWNGTGNGPDQANDIQFANNRVYATGYLNSTVVGHDFFTLALTIDGDSLWGNIYNDNTYNQYDLANDLVITSDGNIVVTGQSDRDPTNLNNDDYLTIAYAPNGSQLWLQRFNGIANGIDRAAAICSDNAGNVYVTGRSDNGGDDDYVTIKYSASGASVWNISMDNGGNDRAEDIDIDGSGNVYTVGRSSNGVDNDIRTVKYSSAGTVLFNVAYDYIEDDRGDMIDVATDGSLVVGGRSDVSLGATINYDVTIVKYSSTGTLIWDSTYGNTSNTDDAITDIQFTADGGVIFCGYSVQSAATLTIFNQFANKLNATGNTTWTYTYAASPNNNDQFFACAELTNGSVVTCGTSEDANARGNGQVKWLNNSGALLNTASINGRGDNSDNVRKIALDAQGNIYVAAYQVRKNNDRDLSLLKLSASGDTIWTRQMTGTLNGSDDDATGLILDAQGNIYISGYVKNSGSSSDIVIGKYNSAGVQQWMYTYNSPFSESDRGYDLSIDPTGNLILTGKTDINNSPLILNDEIFTVKLNAAGVQLWTATYTGTSGADRGKFVRTASDGKIDIVGWVQNGTENNLMVMQYSTTGTELWHATTASPNGGSFNPKDVALDASGNIYIAGTVENALDPYAQSGFAAHYSATGALLWMQYFNLNAGYIDIERVLILSNGDATIVGAVTAGTDVYPYTARLGSADGNTIWQTNCDLISGNAHFSDDAVQTADGKLLIVSHYDDQADINVEHIKTAISIVDLTTGAAGPAASISYSDSLTVFNDILLNGTTLWMGGSAWTPDGQRDILISKWDIITGLQETEKTSKLRVYPNPAENEIQVLVKPEDIGGTMNVYQSTGVLMTSMRILSQETRLPIENWATGLYTIQLVSNNNNNKTSFIKK